jgi:hypothetical protein
VISFNDLRGTHFHHPAVHRRLRRFGAGYLNCNGVVNSVSGVCVVTLTVTDSAGQSDSDVLLMVFIDQAPG